MCVCERERERKREYFIDHQLLYCSSNSHKLQKNTCNFEWHSVGTRKRIPGCLQAIDKIKENSSDELLKNKTFETS